VVGGRPELLGAGSDGHEVYVGLVVSPVVELRVQEDMVGTR
jgi:hypothetical protein